jgi:hypothetical protein
MTRAFWSGRRSFMQDISQKQFIFIVGAPRSGTTWLQLLLSAHQDVCTTVELTLFDRYIGPWVGVWEDEARSIELGRWHQGLPFIWSEEEFYGFLREFLGRAYSSVLAMRPHATHVLDKHPRYSLHIELIDRLLPNAKFIHMIRDGRDVVLSMLEARKSMGFGAESTEAAAKLWREYTLSARKAAEYDGRYFELRYENLCHNGEKALRDVFDFCELPTSAELVRSILREHSFATNKANRKMPVGDPRVKAPKGHYRKGKVGSWQEELSAEQRQVFEGIAGALLQELGYARDASWVVFERDGKECVEVF